MLRADHVSLQAPPPMFLGTEQCTPLIHEAHFLLHAHSHSVPSYESLTSGPHQMHQPAYIKQPPPPLIKSYSMHNDVTLNPASYPLACSPECPNAVHVFPIKKKSGVFIWPCNEQHHFLGIRLYNSDSSIPMPLPKKQQNQIGSKTRFFAPSKPPLAMNDPQNLASDKFQNLQQSPKCHLNNSSEHDAPPPHSLI